MQKPLIIGNWKMNYTTVEAIGLCKNIMEELKDIDTVDIVVAPPFTSIEILSALLNHANISLAAQNVHFEAQGAYTGEISVAMLKHIDVKYIIVGHSERRTYFAETNEIVAKKAKAVLANGLIPVICVGENMVVREEKKYLEHIKNQLLPILNNLDENLAEEIVIAYEPIWAIGTGKSAKEKDAEEVLSYVRKLLQNTFSSDVANKIRLLYGGSVNAQNIASLLQESNIDGALVGGASLAAKSFVEIIDAVK